MAQHNYTIQKSLKLEDRNKNKAKDTERPFIRGQIQMVNNTWKVQTH